MRFQDAVSSEIFGGGIIGGANAGGGLLEVVRSATPFNLRSEHEPVSTGFAIRHPDAARIDDADAANRAVELHMGMTANDKRSFRGLKDRHEPVFGGKAGEDVGVVARCRMTEENVPQ